VHPPSRTGATFYFDLGSPFAYLTAERIDAVLAEPSVVPDGPGAASDEPAAPLGEPTGGFDRPAAAPARRVVWQPVSLGALFKLAGRSSWSLGDPERRRAGIAEVQRRAAAYGLPAVRWPEPWPSNYLFAMRACTYAFAQGRGHEFTLAAFRAAFQRGHDLGVPEHVLAVAAEVGLDPRAVEQATADPAVKAALRAATEDAHRRGVFGVPTVAVGGELFWGDDRLEQAAAALG
jgi:2-hydroxychromene-2-carboxylate isomerase